MSPQRAFQPRPPPIETEGAAGPHRGARKAGGVGRGGASCVTPLHADPHGWFTSDSEHIYVEASLGRFNIAPPFTWKKSAILHNRQDFLIFVKWTQRFLWCEDDIWTKFGGFVVFGCFSRVVSDFRFSIVAIYFFWFAQSFCLFLATIQFSAVLLFFFVCCMLQQHWGGPMWRLEIRFVSRTL